MSVVAGMCAAKATGYVLHWTGSYALLFGAASLAYLVALLLIHLINPRHEPMNLTVATAK
jgi:ACS family hexuronate transporter-like MFS transporter